MDTNWTLFCIVCNDYSIETDGHRHWEAPTLDNIPILSKVLDLAN